MTNDCPRNRYNCLDFAVLASIVIGVIAGILRYMAIITLTPAFLWVIFGIATVTLGLLVAIVTLRRLDLCSIPTIFTAIIGILGTILFSIILLGITFAATSVIGAIISGLAVGFFALIITALSCFIKRSITCND